MAKVSLKKNIKRNKLSDSALKAEIITLFNTGITGKMEVFGTIRKLYTLARDRFTEMYDSCYLEWSKIKEQANSEATTEAAIIVAKSGLKSKIEKQYHLQQQIDEIQNELERGILEKYAVINGEWTMEPQIMNAETKAVLRKTIKELYAELNKMCGDYSPTKIANTDGSGNDISPIINIQVVNPIED
jgi:hypothetical protein